MFVVCKTTISANLGGGGGGGDDSDGGGAMSIVQEYT